MTDELKPVLHARVMLTAAGECGRSAVISAVHADGLHVDLEFLDSVTSCLSLKGILIAALTVVGAPEVDRLYSHTVVNDVLCEVWWRPVPHSYGRWNHENFDMHLWVKVVTPDFDYQKRLDDEIASIHQTLHTRYEDAEKLAEALADHRGNLYRLEEVKARPLLEAPAGIKWIEFMRAERVVWSVTIEGYQRPDYKHECGLRHGYSGSVIRNLKPVGEFFSRSITGALDAARRAIARIEEHPLHSDFDTPEKIIGRKVWYRGQPAKIGSHLMLDQGCVILEYDGPEQEMPANTKVGAPMILRQGFNMIDAEDVGDDGGWHEQGPSSVKEDIHATGIRWHRRDPETPA